MNINDILNVFNLPIDTYINLSDNQKYLLDTTLQLANEYPEQTANILYIPPSFNIDTTLYSERINALLKNFKITASAPAYRDDTVYYTNAYMYTDSKANTLDSCTINQLKEHINKHGINITDLKSEISAIAKLRN